MSDLPFFFHAPTPRYFRDNGLFKNQKNLAFVTWCFERCSAIERTIFHDDQKITLKPYQFIFGRSVCCEATGLTDDEVRTQQNRWEKYGFLKKAPNQTPNRFTLYEWVLSAFLKHDPQPNPQQTPNRPPARPPQSRYKIERSKEDPPLSPPSESARDEDLFSPSGERLLEICSGVRMTQSQLNECIASRGDLETVTLIVQQICSWPARKYKITDWVSNIKSWRIKNDLASKLIENETVAIRMESLYAESDTGWTCRIYNDKRRDCRGLLFEGRGAYVEPIFVNLSDYDFKAKVARIIREKKMHKSKEKTFC